VKVYVKKMRSSEPRNLRILSWNVLDPDSGFLGVIRESWKRAAKEHKQSFLTWWAGWSVRPEELVFVPNPSSDCLKSMKDTFRNRDEAWYPSFQTAGPCVEGPCKLLAYKSKGEWYHVRKRDEQEAYAFKDKDKVDVAVFEGSYCGFQIPPSAGSEYSKLRMELVKLFIWQCLAGRDKGLNIHADIVCLQEAPEELSTYFGQQQKLFCSNCVGGVLTIVKKKIMEDSNDVIEKDGWSFWRDSLVAFRLNEEYQQTVGCKWLSIINSHGPGSNDGEAGANYVRTLFTEAKEYGRKFPGQLTILTGDYNVTLNEYFDEGGNWREEHMSSLLLGNKGIEACAVMKAPKAPFSWVLKDVRDELDEDKFAEEADKIIIRKKLFKKLFELKGELSHLLDEADLKNFSSETDVSDFLKKVQKVQKVQPESTPGEQLFLMDYVTGKEEYNFRDISDHAPLLAEIQIAPRKSDDDVSFEEAWAGSESLAYRLFKFYRMVPPTAGAEEEGRQRSQSSSVRRRGSPAKKRGESSLSARHSGGSRSSSQGPHRDARGRFARTPSPSRAATGSRH
jgi:uncharacterized protein YkuJ